MLSANFNGFFLMLMTPFQGFKARFPYVSSKNIGYKKTLDYLICNNITLVNWQFILIYFMMILRFFFWWIKV